MIERLPSVPIPGFTRGIEALLEAFFLSTLGTEYIAVAGEKCSVPQCLNSFQIGLKQSERDTLTFNVRPAALHRTSFFDLIRALSKGSSFVFLLRIFNLVLTSPEPRREGRRYTIYEKQDCTLLERMCVVVCGDLDASAIDYSESGYLAEEFSSRRRLQ